jgi:uncharacterized protein (DUF885 family)
LEIDDVSTTDRRTFMAAALGTALAISRPRTGSTTDADRLDALLGRMFAQEMRESPQDMTSLGLDTGSGAWARSKLNDASRAHIDHMVKLRQRWSQELEQIDPKRLSGMAAANYATVRYQNELALRGAKSFSYGRDAFPAPYVLSQITGAYQHVPDFLDSQHVVADRHDAEAYLTRLSEFARVMDQETARALHESSAGVVPPDFVIDKTLLQMKTLRSTPVEQTPLVASLVRRAKDKGIAGDWSARATKAVSSAVWPALDRQIALLQRWRTSARSDAGVWALPRGEEYYRFAAHYQTTTDITPAEIHRLGLELVAQLSSNLDELLKQQGMSVGTVGERMAALYKDPRFIYPSTDAGRAELLAYLNGCVRAVTAKLPEYFGAIPKAALEIRRIPVETEAGSPGGYYEDGTLDGSRPGVYYVNLRDMAEVPRWTLPTLTYHEGIPGHHFQGALVLEAKGLPMLRRTLWFTGYGEGWALYSEQLAEEMGLYASDPWGRAGYLHDALFRAVRLVLDSGLHEKRWTRTQAIHYYMSTMGDPESVATTEVERYCVWPGQACSYMIGKLTWLKLRSRAQQTLGAKFDIRKFHDAGLLSGPMPLDVLDQWIDAWIRQQA